MLVSVRWSVGSLVHCALLELIPWMRKGATFVFNTTQCKYLSLFSHKINGPTFLGLVLVLFEDMQRRFVEIFLAGWIGLYMSFSSRTSVSTLNSCCFVYRFVCYAIYLKKRIVAHEMGHAIGFFHEQSRPDRDRFVDIVEENILAPNLFNFDKLPVSRIDSKAVPYDLRSVMHYGARVRDISHVCNKVKKIL